MTKKATQSFVLTKNEIDLIRAKAAATGDISNSAALRSIIREWATMNAMPSSILPKASPATDIPESESGESRALRSNKAL